MKAIKELKLATNKVLDRKYRIQFVLQNKINFRQKKGEVLKLNKEPSNFFFFLSDVHSTWKFPGQGSNLGHSISPSRCNDNAQFLTYSAPREFPK